MSKIWLYSDPHFWHTNIIKYAGRPFPDVEAMNMALVHALNEQVSKQDHLLITGDFAYGREAYKRRIYDIRQQINCRNIYLFKGNHDSKIASAQQWIHKGGMRAYIQKHGDYLVIAPYIFVYLQTNDKFCLEGLEGQYQLIYLSHRPLHDQKEGPYFWGHIHEKEVRGLQRGHCICVEHTDYKPILLGEADA